MPKRIIFWLDYRPRENGSLGDILPSSNLSWSIHNLRLKDLKFLHIIFDGQMKLKKVNRAIDLKCPINLRRASDKLFEELLEKGSEAGYSTLQATQAEGAIYPR